jgi:hypothetical protein
MQQILQNETVAVYRQIPFRCVSAADGRTPQTGLSFTPGDIKLSKHVAYANAVGTVTEIGLGDYLYEATVSEVNTLGLLLLRVEKSGVLPFVAAAHVVFQLRWATTVAATPAAAPVSVVVKDPKSQSIPAIEAGNAVVLRARTRDNTKQTPVAVDPTTITVSLLNPDGVFLVQDVPMVKVGVEYQYIHQTGASDPSGDYMQVVKTSYQGKYNQETAVAFVLVRA